MIFDKKKKIAQVVCVFPPYHGGIGNAAFCLHREFISKGHKSSVFTPRYKATTSEEGGVKRLFPLLKYGNGAFLPQLLWRLRSYDVIILHYPFFGGSEAVALLKILLGSKIKLLVYYHMDVVGLSFFARILSWPSRMIEGKMFLAADKVLTASLDYVQNGAIKGFYEKYLSKFVEIPFGVDADFFYPASGEKEKFILFVGGLDRAHYFKGLDVLISALSSCESDFRLVVIGNGELLSYFRDFAVKNGVNDRVDFLSGVGNEELRSYYQRASCFVLPSINKGEAFGLVLLEAMACGCPVVASSLPGVRSVFSEGMQGFFSRPGDVSSLAAAINKIITNPNLIKDMGKKGRDLVLEKYSWRKSANKIENLFL